MPRKSTIEQLPKQIREKISELRNNGRTIDEILEHLSAMDVDVSRSSLGRHIKKQAAVAESIRKSRQMAEAITQHFGDKETGKVARTNMELMHSILMKIMIGDEEDGGLIELNPKDAMMLATSIQKLSQASKLDADRELKIREEERARAKEDAAKIAVSTAKKQGLSADTVEKIRSEILGIS